MKKEAIWLPGGKKYGMRFHEIRIIPAIIIRAYLMLTVMFQFSLFSIRFDSETCRKGKGPSYLGANLATISCGAELRLSFNYHLLPDLHFYKVPTPIVMHLLLLQGCFAELPEPRINFHLYLHLIARRSSRLWRSYIQTG